MWQTHRLGTCNVTFLTNFFFSRSITTACSNVNNFTFTFTFQTTYTNVSGEMWRKKKGEGWKRRGGKRRGLGEKGRREERAGREGEEGGEG